MGKNKSVVSLLILDLLVLTLIPCTFGASENWVEVARFSGINEDKTTDSFLCDCPEWRIRWEFIPTFNSMIFHDCFIFSITTYPVKEINRPLHLAQNVDEVVVKIGDKSTYTAKDGVAYGTLHIQVNGEFFLVIETESSFVTSYTIIVEQNLDSIPEFPSWIVLPLFLGSAFVIVVFKKKNGFGAIK